MNDTHTADKIKVKTRDFDEIEITEKDIINFPNGIFAFEEYKNYIIISPLGCGKYPVWLQSTENQNLCFILFNPMEFCADYRAEVDDDEISVIDLKSSEDAMLYVIAVIPEDNMKATVNLKSPIIVNTVNNKAVQVIVTDDYPIKFPAFAQGG